MDSLAKMNIAVIGAGLMGHSIAQIFLAAGHKVALQDPDLEVLNSAPQRIADIFSLLEQNAELQKNLSLHEDLNEAVAEANFVVEAGPEKLDIKQNIFKQLGELTSPTTILATNTSAIPIGEITAGINSPDRAVGAHFWNPPHLVRLVEVVQTEATSDKTLQEAMSLFEQIGMKPVHLTRDVPGFIGNRLQHAMKREAIALIEQGICDAETIDTVVKHGFGSRLAVLGPMEQSDLVGLNLTLDIYKTLFPTLNNCAEPPQLLVDKVNKGELGMRTGKGFRDWTPESAEQVKSDLQRYLLQQAKKNKDQKN